MFSYSSYLHQFDQRSPSELEAIADDLEYRASRARRAARLEAPEFHFRPQQRVYLDEMQPRHVPARPRVGRFELPPRQSFHYEPEPIRHRYPGDENPRATFPLYDDYIGEQYSYTQMPTRGQHRPRSSVNFRYSGMSPEQYEREMQESRIHAVAEGAGARARTEARRVEILGERARAEQQRAYARKQREERVRAQMEEQSRALAVREVEEAAQAVASLIFGNQSDEMVSSKFERVSKYFKC
jgi:hypothetical protein